MTQTCAKTAEKIDVRYVAHLARLDLTDEEAARLQGQLENIVAYVHTLDALNVENVEPTAHAMAVVNVFRKDEPRPGLDHEQVMRNAPVRRGELFGAPKIIE